jgi:carboxylate-amine ligase
MILPMLPALCASSPLLDGKSTGMLDTRLKFYKSNQAKIPSITGKVIPEAVFSRRLYLNTIYEKIKSDIAPFDPQQELNPIWVNSRGAIPRFDRGSIEIRVMDIQECPAADLAIVALVIEIIKAFTAGKFIDHETQIKWKTDVLAQLLDQTAEKAQDAVIGNAEYLHVFGYPDKSAKAGDLWRHILESMLQESDGALQKWKPQLDVIVGKGTLAARILNSLDHGQSRDRVIATYKELSACLAENRMFTP